MDKCPRCKLDWNRFDCNVMDDVLECQDCKFQIIMNDNGQPSSANWFIDTATGTQLNWNFQEHACQYNVGSKKSEEFNIWFLFTTTELPWLPFDISLNRLKTLILFS